MANPLWLSEQGLSTRLKLSCSSCAWRALWIQIWDKRESQVSANTEPALQLFCKTVSCSPLSPWQSGAWTQLCPQCFRDSRSSKSSSLLSSSLTLTWRWLWWSARWGVPMEEATADPLLGSSCIFTDAIFPGIIHVERDCPRVNHYPVL